MPLLSSKHRKEDTLLLANMTGGVNYSLPPDLIDDKELSGGLNFFYDPNTYRLMNRPGVARYSTTGEASGNPIDGGFYSSILSKDLVSSNDVLYYLDGAEALTSIGTLNGTLKPHFLDFNGKVVVSSGGTLESTNGLTLSDCTGGAPVSKKILSYNGRVVSAGDTTYPHRLFMSEPGNENQWSSVSPADGKYFDVALGVGEGIVDFNIHGDDIIIYKGTQERGIYQLVIPSGDFSIAHIKEVSKVNSCVNFYSSIQFGNELYFLDSHGFKGLVSTQKYGDIEQDEAGGKINSVILSTITSDAFVAANPNYQQIWVKYADVATNYVFYPLLKAFLPVQFSGGLKAHSAWYHEGDKIFLFGMSDGWVYKLDNSVYTDNGTAVPAHIYSKKFRTLEGFKRTGSLFRKLLKQTILDYEGIAEGAATLQFEIDGGSSRITLGTITLTSGFDLLYEATGYLNDATDYLYGDNSATAILNKLVNFYDARFLLSVTSGAIKLNQIESRVALSGRR